MGLTRAATAGAVGAPSRQPALNRAGLLPPGPRWPTSALTPRGFQTRASQSAGGGESGASSPQVPKPSEENFKVYKQDTKSLARVNKSLRRQLLPTAQAATGSDRPTWQLCS